MTTYNAAMGQESIEAAIAAEGFVQSCYGSSYVWIKTTSAVVALDNGPDWTGTAGTGAYDAPVVRVFEYIALRDEDDRLVCAVPGDEVQPDDGICWALGASGVTKAPLPRSAKPMIVNLTQHTASTEQLAVGVVDLPVAEMATLIDRLTVYDLPTRTEIEARCADIATLAATAFDAHPAQAMIGGAPWMMACLEAALLDHGIEPVYAFSRRESVEQVQSDGSVRKTAVFRHTGFVPAR